MNFLSRTAQHEKKVSSDLPDRQDTTAARSEPAAAQVSSNPSETMPVEPASIGTEASRPYASNGEHLMEELCRLDLLIRAQTLHWRMTIGASKPENLWGMLQVSDAEIQAFLHSQFLQPGSLPPEAHQFISPWWEQAAAWRVHIDARLEKTPAEVDLRLRRLQRLFNLTPLQRDLLLVCLLPELDGRYRRLFGYLLDDASRTQPTMELAAQILAPGIHRPLTAVQQDDGGLAIREAVDRSGALVANSLVVLDGEMRGDAGLSMRSMRLDDRISAFLLGGNRLDPHLEGILSQETGRMNWEELPFSGSQLARLRSLAGELREPGEQKPVLLFHGHYGSGRLKAARALCTAAGLGLLVVSLQAALDSPLGWERAMALCYREAALQGAALYWSGCDRLLERNSEGSALQSAQRWEQLVAGSEQSPCLSIFAASTAWYPALHFRFRRFLCLEFPPPSFGLRVRLWEKNLRGSQAAASITSILAPLARELANEFQFTEGQILDALATACGQALLRDPSRPALQPQDLYEGCRRQASRSLVTFARRIEPRGELTFDDLILPRSNKCQLEEVALRIRYRNLVYSELGFERRLSLGKGLIVLFTGTSGTGKTMAAELLARKRGVDLYKVDLSAITSKWVGETEKNLARLFAEAEQANAIIFFDEADALFGKRGDVKEAQDRWANMEVNFLLQRIEEYAGVVILATNLRQNIDEAFLRRIQWVVDFPFPNAEARFQIFKSMFPSNVGFPADEGLRILAQRFRFTGGSIKNVVVDATFRAMTKYDPDCGQPPHVQMQHLVLAAAREYQKLGLPITKGEFGESYYNLVERAILAPPEVERNA